MVWYTRDWFLNHNNYETMILEFITTRQKLHDVNYYEGQKTPSQSA